MWGVKVDDLPAWTAATDTAEMLGSPASRLMEVTAPARFTATCCTARTGMGLLVEDRATGGRVGSKADRPAGC